MPNAIWTMCRSAPNFAAPQEPPETKAPDPLPYFGLIGEKVLNFLGALTYVIIAVCCIHAIRSSRKAPWPCGHAEWTWGLAIGLLVILFLFRMLDLEDTIRDGLRAVLRLDGAYVARRSIQGPIAAVTIVSLALCMIVIWRLPVGPGDARSRSALRTARLACLGLLGLLGLRLVSLHSLDQVLYHGPHLNWFLDFGGALIIGLAALGYARTVSAIAKRAHPRHHDSPSAFS